MRHIYPAHRRSVNPVKLCVFGKVYSFRLIKGPSCDGDGEGLYLEQEDLQPYAMEVFLLISSHFEGWSRDVADRSLKVRHSRTVLK